MKVSRVLLGTVAAAALILTAAAFDAVAQKKKKSRCKDGESETVATYKVEKGEHLPAAIKASLTGKPGDAEKGLKWMVHRRLGNCIACHQVTSILQRAKDDDLASLRKYGFHGKIAPPLDGAAERYTEAELRMIVVDIKKAFPDANSIMPSFHRKDGFTRVIGDCKELAILSADRVEDIVAFLKTLK
ncbi:MAG: c-type cytochrome [Methyloligellaceae bacterium]